MRAINTTCSRISAEASRPATRPILVRPPPTVMKPLRPPPATQSATTNSRTPHANDADTPRHHRVRHIEARLPPAANAGGSPAAVPRHEMAVSK